MKLLEPVVGLSVGEHAGIADIELDGVTVVGNSLRMLVPHDLDGIELRANRRANIDRRLLHA